MLREISPSARWAEDGQIRNLSIHALLAIQLANAFSDGHFLVAQGTETNSLPSGQRGLRPIRMLIWGAVEPLARDYPAILFAKLTIPADFSRLATPYQPVRQHRSGAAPPQQA
jgi:hypothetical protein